SFSMYTEPAQLTGVPPRPPGQISLPRHNLLQVLLTVPLFVLGMPLNARIPDVASAFHGLPVGSVLAVSLLNPLLTLIAVWLIVRIGHRLDFSDRASQMAGILYGCATMAWPYAGIGMEPLQTTMILLSFLMILRLRDAPTLPRTLWASLSVAGLMHTKISTPLLALPVAVAGLHALCTGPLSRRHRFQRVGLYCLSLGAASALWFGLYAFRKSTQYTPGFFDNVQPHLILRNITGFIISPGKSIFAYSPVLLWSLAGVPAFFRRYRGPAAVLSMTALLTLLLIAPWDWSLIEECWGPRYLMPLVPILMILGMPAMERAYRRPARIGLMLLVVISVLVQIPGVLYPNANILMYSQNREVPVVDLTTWAPDLSPIVVGWHLTINKIRESIGEKMVPLSWIHYRGIVGHGTKPTVTEFEDHGKNRPFTAPFLLSRYFQKRADASGSPDRPPAPRHDPPWIFTVWLGVTLCLLFPLLETVRRLLAAQGKEVSP
ncbi:MAG TPA: hypothetical protein PLV45_13750, partial [bacterium]|nr:hypothetical protein [bacterium]